MIQHHVVYELHANGRIKERHSAELDEDGNILDEDKQGFITEQEPRYVHQPSWNGVEWVESETQEEREIREIEEALEALNPTPEEIADSELEIKMLTLLMELEMV